MPAPKGPLTTYKGIKMTWAQYEQMRQMEKAPEVTWEKLRAWFDTQGVYLPEKEPKEPPRK
jgi:hypothetical protein